MPIYYSSVMLSRRLDNISPSKTVSLSNKASELKKSGKKVYNFGIGEPDFTTPDGIIKAAFDAAKAGKTHYTPSSGIPELRSAIADKMKKVNNVPAESGNVLVTNTKFSINLAAMALLNPGDEVLIPEPYYLSYPEIMKLYGAKPVPVRSDEDYDIDFDELRKMTSPRTKALIYSSPSNPTGKVFSEKLLRKLSDYIIENDMILIADEIYEDIIFEGKPFSPASIPEMFDRTVTVNGFSKSHAMTGWRIGYMVANESIIKASDKIQQQTITCAPSVSQYAALAALEDKKSPKDFRDKFLHRRDLVRKLLSNSSLKSRNPEGAFYAFPQYHLDINSEKFCNLLLERKNVIVTPGSAFGEQGKNHFRLSFATDDETIMEGIERIIRFTEGYSGNV